MTGPYTSLGKEVLRGPLHFADADNVTNAERIARAMNILWDIEQGEQSDDDDRQSELFEPAPDTLDPYDFDPNLTHATRQEGDEYACKCGVRWPVSEGRDHP